jgi:hypothetical protein
MSGRDKTKKKLVGKQGNTVDGSITGDDLDYEEGRGWLRLRYSIPIWLNTALLILILLMAFGVLVVTVYHYRHDADAYVCNEDDRDRWQCDAVFEPDTEQCEELPYKDWATGGAFQTCFYDNCVYFKTWEPVVPYPCVGTGEVFPQTGRERCLDFVDPSYEKRDRLFVTLFCMEGDAICIYRDKCAHYEIEQNEEETLGSSSLSPSGEAQLRIMNGTNFYVYGSLQALGKSR